MSAGRLTGVTAAQHTHERGKEHKQPLKSKPTPQAGGFEQDFCGFFFFFSILDSGGVIKSSASRMCYNALSPRFRGFTCNIVSNWNSLADPGWFYPNKYPHLATLWYQFSNAFIKKIRLLYVHFLCPHVAVMHRLFWQFQTCNSKPEAGIKLFFLLLFLMCILICMFWDQIKQIHSTGMAINGWKLTFHWLANLFLALWLSWDLVTAYSKF